LHPRTWVLFSYHCCCFIIIVIVVVVVIVKLVTNKQVTSFQDVVLFSYSCCCYIVIVIAVVVVVIILVLFVLLLLSLLMWQTGHVIPGCEFDFVMLLLY
jgi:hypothetical protein